MKNLDNIYLIEFDYHGVTTVAIFNIISISEEDVREFILNQYPMGYDPRIVFMSRFQWDTIFEEFYTTASKIFYYLK